MRRVLAIPFLVGLGSLSALCAEEPAPLAPEAFSRVMDCLLLRDLGVQKPAFDDGGVSVSAKVTRALESGPLEVEVAFWHPRGGRYFDLRLGESRQVSIANSAEFFEREGDVDVGDLMIGGVDSYARVREALRALQREERQDLNRKDLVTTDAACFSALRPDGVRR